MVLQLRTMSILHRRVQSLRLCNPLHSILYFLRSRDLHAALFSGVSNLGTARRIQKWPCSRSLSFFHYILHPMASSRHYPSPHQTTPRSSHRSHGTPTYPPPFPTAAAAASTNNNPGATSRPTPVQNLVCGYSSSLRPLLRDTPSHYPSPICLFLGPDTIIGSQLTGAVSSLAGRHSVAVEIHRSAFMSSGAQDIMKELTKLQSWTLNVVENAFTQPIFVSVGMKGKVVQVAEFSLSGHPVSATLLPQSAMYVLQWIVGGQLGVSVTYWALGATLRTLDVPLSFLVGPGIPFSSVINLTLLKLRSPRHQSEALSQNDYARAVAGFDGIRGLRSIEHVELPQLFIGNIIISTLGSLPKLNKVVITPWKHQGNQCTLLNECTAAGAFSKLRSIWCWGTFSFLEQIIAAFCRGSDRSMDIRASVPSISTAKEMKGFLKCVKHRCPGVTTLVIGVQKVDPRHSKTWMSISPLLHLRHIQRFELTHPWRLPFNDKTIQDLVQTWAHAEHICFNPHPSSWDRVNDSPQIVSRRVTPSYFVSPPTTPSRDRYPHVTPGCLRPIAWHSSLESFGVYISEPEPDRGYALDITFSNRRIQLDLGGIHHHTRLIGGKDCRLPSMLPEACVGLQVLAIGISTNFLTFF